MERCRLFILTAGGAADTQSVENLQSEGLQEKRGGGSADERVPVTLSASCHFAQDVTATKNDSVIRRVTLLT